jgi:hypothetical protein
MKEAGLEDEARKDWRESWSRMVWEPNLVLVQIQPTEQINKIGKGNIGFH